jgi:hypothetical protein
MSLDEQIVGLEAIPTADAVQFKAKASILSTLRALRTMRSQFEEGNPNEGKVVRLMLEVLGERVGPPPKRTES